MIDAFLVFTLAQSLPADEGTGQFLLNGQPISQVTARLIDYVGDCPGQGIARITGVSFLASEGPGPYRRIVIRNKTTSGFTDREYDERRPTAQPFVMGIAQGHHGSFLSLAPGNNEFTYSVSNRIQQKELGQGTANLFVTKERVSRQRSFSSINTDQYCLTNRSRDLSNCPNGLITIERTGMCPDGSRRTLSLETIRGSL